MHSHSVTADEARADWIFTVAERYLIDHPDMDPDVALAKATREWEEQE